MTFSIRVTVALLIRGFTEASGHTPLKFHGFTEASGHTPLQVHGFTEASGQTPLQVHGFAEASGHTLLQSLSLCNSHISHLSIDLDAMATDASLLIFY